MTVLGVDPGASGALAWLTEDGALIAVADMPVIDGVTDPYMLIALLREHVTTIAIVERVGAMPKQGVSSTFKFGRSYGIVLGAIAALDIRIEHAAPTSWKRSMLLTKDKGASRRLAIERWPAHADSFKRVKDDGRAEAALIGLWGIQHRLIGRGVA